MQKHESSQMADQEAFRAARALEAHVARAKIIVEVGRREVPLEEVKRPPKPSASSEWEIAWRAGQPEGRWHIGAARKGSSRHRKVA